MAARRKRAAAGDAGCRVSRQQIVGRHDEPSRCIPSLKEVGFVEGENVRIEYRWAENKADQLKEMAAELVRMPIDGLVAKFYSGIFETGFDGLSNNPRWCAAICFSVLKRKWA